MAKLLLAFLFSLIVSVQTAGALTLTARDGQVIEFDKPFTRIISLYPAHTENLFSLGLDEEIIGVSGSDDYPAKVKAKARFSYREDAEKIIGAKPDLVIIRPMISRGYRGLVEKLRQAGITVVSLQPTSVEQMYLYWQTLGDLSGHRQQAEEMIREFKNELGRISAELQVVPEESRKRVYFESIHKKMKTFAPASMAVFTLISGGGKNIAEDSLQVRKTNIAAYGKERILSHAGEIEVFLAQIGRMNRVKLVDIYQEPGFKVIKAVRDKQVFLVDEKLISRPTMRLLAGIRQIRSLLYPDIFKK